MGLIEIAVMIALAGVYLLVMPRAWRAWALMILSVIAVYWLQPRLQIRWLDYTLPTATLILAGIGWLVTRDKNTRITRGDAAAAAIALGVALLLTLSRYVAFPVELTSRPPQTIETTISIVIVLAMALILARVIPQRRLLNVALIAVIALFVAVKAPALAELIAGGLRANAGQDSSLAQANELNWLGFSYVAFRLIQTIRDRQSGILPPISLRDYFTFIVFFPAFTAGPIDRAEVFSTNIAKLRDLVGWDSQRITIASTRIGVGLFKKFVIADSLAFFSLNATTASQAQDTGAMWLLLYSYAFRLYFDFSGYTDIAIGIALLFGMPLPENFDRPYTRQNITIFWQSWHKSLSDWVRFYVYSPLSRSLLRRKPKPSNTVIIFVCTLLTMTVIGLWHGITMVFLIWGVWHALGLFAHKQWTDRTRSWYRGLTGWRKRAWHLIGILLTFHFVALGWVWFVMPGVTSAIRTFGKLFGLGW
jgi:alginate O-acetyltransferase complex protein AlgI